MIVPSPSQHALFPEGGAVARGSADWPVPWRNAPWCVHPFGLWSDRADDARGRQWTRDVRAAVAPWATGAVYLNFIGDEGEDRVVAGFGAEPTAGSPGSSGSTIPTTSSTSTTISGPPDGRPARPKERPGYFAG